MSPVTEIVHVAVRRPARMSSALSGIRATRSSLWNGTSFSSIQPAASPAARTIWSWYRGSDLEKLITARGMA